MENNNHTQPRFKKGDEVYIVSSYTYVDADNNPKTNKDADPARTLVCAIRVTLTSLGKVQGTGVYVNDKNTKHRIYASSRLVRTRDEVLDIARNEVLPATPAMIEKSIRHTGEWLARFKGNGGSMDAVQRAEAKIDYLRTAIPSTRIWFFDGETEESVIVKAD